MEGGLQSNPCNFATSPLQRLVIPRCLDARIPASTRRQRAIHICGYVHVATYSSLLRVRYFASELAEPRGRAYNGLDLSGG